MPRSEVTSTRRETARHSGEQRRTVVGRENDLPGLGLAGHAVGGVHRRAEDVLVLEHDRSEVTADADRDVLALHQQFGPGADVLLHLAAGVHGVVHGREDREDLVADGLDDRAAVAPGCLAHDLDAELDQLARALVAEQLVQASAANDIGEEDGDFRLGTGHARQNPWAPVAGRLTRIDFTL